MGIPQLVLEKLQQLPPEKQQEVLDFTEFLALKAREKRPRSDLYSLLAHLGISISAEDIDDARKEIWGNFRGKDT